MNQISIILILQRNFTKQNKNNSKLISCIPAQMFKIIISFHVAVFECKIVYIPNARLTICLCNLYKMQYTKERKKIIYSQTASSTTFFVNKF